MFLKKYLVILDFRNATLMNFNVKRNFENY